MASSLQTYQQDAHSIHFSKLTMRAFFSTISKQPARQTFIQLPHPTHLDSIISMNLPVPLTHSTPGNSLKVLPIISSPLHLEPEKAMDLRTQQISITF
jgi:hypothetical protein